jgi:drug/metabolite transporter (DMT)-like permease
MRLTRLPIEALSLLYLILYVPYMLVTRALATMPDAELSRPLTGLETLPAVLILGSVLTALFIWSSGWWRSANRVSIRGLRVPFPRKWTAISGVGTSLLLFTVPLSLTFEGVSIPFMQLLMRGDVLIIAPLVDVIAGRRVRWYSWVAMTLVAVALTLGVWGRGGFHLPPLAILAVALYTLGYFMRLAAMTRVSKNGDENSVRGYFVEEKIIGMPLSIVAIALVTLSPLGAQGAQVGWGFVNVWSSDALPFLLLISVAFVGISIFAALILLDPRENTFCVPFERAASILAGTATAYVLAFFIGLPWPTPMELIGTILVIAAIALLSLAPRRSSVLFMPSDREAVTADADAPLQSRQN